MGGVRRWIALALGLTLVGAVASALALVPDEVATPHPRTGRESLPPSAASLTAPLMPLAELTTLVPESFRSARVQTFNECPRFAIMQPEQNPYRGFYFTRGAYSGGGFRGSRWATDFEKADRQFITVIDRVLNIDVFPCENPIRLDDPLLRRFPFLYMVEVGSLGLYPEEVEGLRSYLLQGGFLLVDDFWGTFEWQSFERSIRQVLPEFPIVEIPMDHIVFRIVYPVPEVLQVPSINNARRGVYHEQDGYTPHMRGIFDEEGRLLVAISWNSDMGDAWEWAEQPDYPWDRSNYALQMGMNFIVYATTH